jgi:hypothetical protein
MSGVSGDRCSSPLSSNWGNGARALVGDVRVDGPAGTAFGKEDRSIMAGRESPVKYLSNQLLFAKVKHTSDDPSSQLS